MHVCRSEAKIVEMYIHTKIRAVSLREPPLCVHCAARVKCLKNSVHSYIFSHLASSSSSFFSILFFVFNFFDMQLLTRVVYCNVSFVYYLHPGRNRVSFPRPFLYLVSFCCYFYRIFVDEGGASNVNVNVCTK